MVLLADLHHYCNEVLDIPSFEDYAPNGLQIEGRAEVDCLVVAVTASLETIEAAIAAGADALLVHHGYFWKGEPAPIVGMKQRRIARLLASGVSLLAYHLPLDAHAEFGNNAALAKVLGVEVDGVLAGGNGLVMHGRLPRAMSGHELRAHIAERLDREPLHIAGHERSIRTIGWCSGAAQGYCELAARSGLDAFISGEVSEQTTHVCRELAIDYYAAGHHATERYGVQALARHLSQHLGLRWKFVDLDNPV